VKKQSIQVHAILRNKKYICTQKRRRIFLSNPYSLVALLSCHQVLTMSASFFYAANLKGLAFFCSVMTKHIFIVILF
jgi:hypothetical protein